MDIENLIYRILAGEATEAEHGEVSRWLDESDRHRAVYRDIERVWYTGKYAGYWKKETGMTWEALEQKHRLRQRNRWLWKGGSVAAAMVLLLGTGLLLFREKEDCLPANPVVAQIEKTSGTKTVLLLSTGQKVELGGGTDTIWENGAGIRTRGNTVSYEQGEASEDAAEMAYNELIVAVGGANKLRLPDGTTVYLNSASRLKFPVRFSGGRREVTLEGEGYFEVIPDAAKPFVVHTPTVEVKVLGTSFNVMAYAADLCTEVTLVTGKVDVKMGECAEILQPEQQFVWNNSNGEYEVKKVDVSVYVDWKEGILNFKAMPLEDLCNRLSRWYGVSFRFAGEDLKRLKFTGAVRKNYDIGYILTMLGAMTDVTFSREGNQVTVIKKE